MPKPAVCRTVHASLKRIRERQGCLLSEAYAFRRRAGHVPGFPPNPAPGGTGAAVEIWAMWEAERDLDRPLFIALKAIEISVTRSRERRGRAAPAKGPLLGLFAADWRKYPTG